MNDGASVTDLSSLREAQHLFQTPLWARFKAEFGWQPRVVDTTLALFRRIGPFTVCYVPYPPLPPTVTAVTIRETGEQICSHTGLSPVYVRFDLFSGTTIRHVADGGSAGRGPAVRKARVDVQPAMTVLLDLLDSDESLLAAMHKKNRYNIRLAERKGVSVRQGGDDEIHAWYALYQETAARDRISIHPLHYYMRLFALAAEYDDVDLRLYLAEYEGQLLAGIIVAHHREMAIYLYGASSNERRNLMPNYALQWHAIMAARTDGCTAYDLFGIPPANDPSHPMHGLYRFKTGFGGSVVHRGGCWDVVFQPGRYTAYRVLESARDYYYHRWKKRDVR